MENMISKTAQIGNNFIIGQGSQIGGNAIISDNVVIGRNCFVDNCNISSDTVIEDNCIIGYGNATGWVSRPGNAPVLNSLEIGSNCLIREGCTLYKGSVLGNEVKIHHKVLLRENTRIGDRTSIGSFTDSEGTLVIGKDCSLHSNNHFCFGTIIEDFVFIAPFCVTTNGNPMGYKRPQLLEKFGVEAGPTIKSGCQIAVNVVILPRVILGYECLVGASTVVTKNYDSLSIIVGVPGKLVGHVEELYRLPIEIRKRIGIDV
ncbi:MAG: hypothetical protein NTX61_06870 [Bacteroidetes bacterium]|nr:hypothetical protein [Bacteroidota bacterium]